MLKKESFDPNLFTVFTHTLTCCVGVFIFLFFEILATKFSLLATTTKHKGPAGMWMTSQSGTRALLHLLWVEFFTGQNVTDDQSN